MAPLLLLIFFFFGTTNSAGAQLACPDGAACPPHPPFPPFHPPHHHPPHLPFLRNVSREDARQFFRIVTSGNETKATIRNQLQSWAQQAGVSAAYATFTTQEQQRAQQFHDNVTANLAGQALQLFNQLWTIRQDDGITRVAECQQYRAAMNGTSPLLRHLVPMMPPSLPGPPPRGCHPRRPPFPPHRFSHSQSHEGGPGRGPGGFGGGPGGFGGGPGGPGGFGGGPPMGENVPNGIDDVDGEEDTE